MAEPRKRTPKMERVKPVVGELSTDPTPSLLTEADEAFYAALNEGTDTLEKIESRNRTGLPEHILEKQRELRKNRNV